MIARAHLSAATPVVCMRTARVGATCSVNVPRASRAACARAFRGAGCGNAFSLMFIDHTGVPEDIAPTL